MMAASLIFISYRRADAVGHAGRLYDRLVDRFGGERIYRDIDTIAAGENFVDSVRQKVNQSDVLLALIGPRWLTAADDEGRWRLADENDLVRFEIATALKRNVRVIPVLLQGAAMPRVGDLPGEIAGLAQRNAVEVRDTHFDQDVAQLVEILGPTWRHRFFRMFHRRPVYAAASLLVAALAGVWLYPKITQLSLTPEQARIQIVQMGLRYDEKAFVQSVQKNDARVATLFLKAGMAPDAKWDGGTALMWAAGEGHLDLAKTLIEKGADINPALPWAAGGGHRELLNYLLSKGPTREGISAALPNATGKERADILQTLLDKGADVNFKNTHGQIALLRAANRPNAEAVRMLIERGADVNAKGKGDETALHAAVSKTQDLKREEPERLGIARALLAKGADVNARAKYQETWQPTPLLEAIRSGYTQLPGLLVEHGANVNAQTDGSTALMEAVKAKLPNVVQALVAKGADVNAHTENGGTALMLAAESYCECGAEIVKLLLAGGAKVDARNDRGETALMKLAGSRYKINIESAQALLSAGADINAASKAGWTALMFAARVKEVDLVRMLVGRGAQLNVKNDDGETALAIASKSGAKEIVKLLTR